jgi:hypothetical protein
MPTIGCKLSCYDISQLQTTPEKDVIPHKKGIKEEKNGFVFKLHCYGLSLKMSPKPSCQQICFCEVNGS